MNCSVCDNEVERVDDKAEAVICSGCVYIGWDFGRLERAKKEKINLID